MVFLTDGQANLSDTPATNSDIINPSAYPNGFCNSVLGGPADGFWDLAVRCKDEVWTPRYCIDAAGDEPARLHRLVQIGQWVAI